MVMRTGAFTGFEVSLRDPGIAWIQLNQPERLNGLTHGIKRDLVETITQAQMDHRVRVLVFTGSGRAFSAGMTSPVKINLYPVRRSCRRFRLGMILKSEPTRV